MNYKSRSNSILILIISFLLTQFLSAQQSNYKFERFTVNNGLSNNSINCIHQTKDGYLWIATKDGLNRYDGQSFKIFKKNLVQKNSLPDNYIMSLHEDKKGSFWIGTWGFGIYKYDPIHESFIPIDKSINHDFVQCIKEDSEGNIWYGTMLNGLKKYSPQSGNISAYNMSQRGVSYLPANNVTEIYFEDASTLWIATWGSGLIKLDIHNGQSKIFRTSVNDLNTISNDRIWSVEKAGNNSIYVCTDSGLDIFNTINYSAIHNPNCPDSLSRKLKTSIRQTLTDHTGKLWIGSYNYQGIFILSPPNKFNQQIVHLLNQDDDPFSLICQRIRWMYEDRYNNIWLGTEDGLNKLPKVKSFEQFKYMPTRKNTLGGRVVSSIYEGQKNILWIGFGGNGFDKIDLNTNNIIHFKNTKEKNSPDMLDVISIIEDKKGIVWLGTSNAGLVRYNPVTNSFKSYTVNPQVPFSIKSNWVQQVLETSDGILLVGTNDGLQVFERERKIFKSFSPEIIPGSDSIPDLISVNSMIEDNQKRIWIGTWLDGLFCYDPLKKNIIHYSPESGNNTISGNKISSITQDSKGNIWIGTFSNGLNKLDPSTNNFIHYNTINGLPNDCVFGALEDKNGFIWISTMKGLAKLNPYNHQMRVYDIEDGLINNQFNWHAYYKNPKGKMYFGGISGFVSFYPDSILKEENTPSVVLTSFKVFDKEATLPHSLPTTEEIILDHNQNFFTLDFTALDLTPVYKHQFAYMLEGIDPQWVNSGTRTTAFYTDITHGNYRFLVKAANADGIWGAPTSINIKIHPAWWNTWWFRILTIGILLGLIFAGYRYRLNQLLKIEKIRFSIASDLHDEIGSNLSSISVDSQSLLSTPGLSESDKELAVDISKTAKATVDAMRDIIWFINPKNDLNEDIIFKMKQTAAKLLSNLEWSFEVSPDARLDTFNLDMRRNIFLLYKEALTNILNHSQAKKCRIIISGGQKNFSLVIEDDGVGFNMANFKSSTGIRSMKARAQKINAKLNFTSDLNNGTRIELVIG